MMNLREIQNAWNALVPLAQARNINARHWAVPPQTIDRGMRRLNWLRSKLGITAPQEQQVEHSLGAALPPIRDIVAQYNALVPEAQARGIRNARLWTGIPSTSLRGFQRLQWLRQQLGQTTAHVAPATIVAESGVAEFDALTWGVEIEALIPIGYDRSTLVHDIKAAGVKCQMEVLNHAVAAHWKMVTDSSIGNSRRAFELVSPPLNGQDGFEQLQKVCAVLKEKRVKVTVKCGLHVHIGWKAGVQVWTGKALANIMRTYVHFEDVIDSYMADSRRGVSAGNGFCNSNRHHVRHSSVILNQPVPSVNEIIMACGQSVTDWRGAARYRKVNLQPIKRHGTVEFRQHQGTIEYDKISNWLKFCLRLVLTGHADRLPAFDAPATFENLAGVMLMPAKEAAQFKKRIEYFAARDQAALRRRAA